MKCYIRRSHLLAMCVSDRRKVGGKEITRNKGHRHEIFRCLPKQLETGRAKTAEPLNTHVNVCTRASADPVHVERVVLSERGHRRSAHTRTCAQLRFDTRTTSCALTGCRADPDVHEAIGMTTALSLVLFSSGSSSRSHGMGSDSYPLPALVQIWVLPN